MRKKYSTIVTISILFTFLLSWGCSDSRRQYGSDGITKVAEPAVDPTLTVLDNSNPTNPEGAGKNQDAIDDKVAKNSSAPITYDKGVANIDFTTTYKEALKILSKPLYGPDSDGLTAYEEKIWIIWSFTKPRRPAAIFANSGYSGLLSLPAPYGDVSPGMELARFFTNDARGENLVRVLYRHFEKAPADYDCLADRQCKVDDSSEQFIQIQLPRLLLLFSKDRLSLFRIIVYPVDDAGALKNDFDLVKGQILVRDQAGKVIDTIGLGISVAELRKKSQYKTEIVEASTLSFTMRFASSVYVGLSRLLDFGRNYLMPRDDEKLETLAAFGLFDKNILINGKNPVVSLAANNVHVKLVDKNTVEETMVARYEAAAKDTRYPEAQRKAFKDHATMLRATHYVMGADEMALTPLMKSIAFQPKVQKEITLSLKKIIEEELTKSFPAGALVTTRLFGMHKEPIDRSFGFNVSAYDTEKKTGRSVEFSLSEEDGAATYFAQLINHPLDDLMMPEAVKPFDANGAALSIFEIGQKIKLTDIDVARGEATLWIGSRKSRVSYSHDGAATLKVRAGDRTIDKIIQLPTVGVNGVVLGLLPDGKNKVGYSAYIQTISSTNRAGIINLCGLKQNFKFGTRDRQFLADMDAALKSEGRNCRRDIPIDAKHGQRIRTVFFPDQGLLITVNDREISSMMKYRILTLAAAQKAEAARAANGGN